MKRFQPLHSNTPLLYSQRLHNRLGKNVYLKMDALQPSASFKLRGIGRLCQYYAAQGINQFIASSGGNAGISVAYCGLKLGIKTTVYIPSTSHTLYIDEIQSYGAEVIVAGNVWDEAHQAAITAAEAARAAYIPPFDHPLIWAGHASLIDELVLVKCKPDAIIAAVGGGGLACGILEGLKHHGWNDVAFVAVETQGADAFARSIVAQKMITLPAITSRATSLGAKHITPRLWEWTKEREILNVVVSDEEAEQGARMLAQDKRVLVELSAGAALSVAYLNHPLIQSYNTVCVIVCGGVNTSFFLG